MDTFSARLTNTRNARGLSRGDLAKLIDMSETAVRLWEVNESRAPKLRTVHRLAEALGVSVNYLIDGKDDNAHRKVRSIPSILEDAVSDISDLLGESAGAIQVRLEIVR